MTKEELITELQKLPDGINVYIHDWRKSLNEDWGDGSSAGIYSEFGVELIDHPQDEREYIKETTGKEFKPWVSLSFESCDYDEEGNCLLTE